MSKQRVPGLTDDRGAPRVVALDAVLDMVKRCGAGLINDYFSTDAWKPYGPVTSRRPLRLAEHRDDRVRRLEADAAAKRLAAGQHGGATMHVSGARSHIRTLSAAQLRRLAKQRQEIAARLRAVPAEDLAVVQKALDIFIRREGGRHALAVLASVDFFVIWLNRSSFQCKHCGHFFVPLGSFQGGRPRSSYSEKCKQAAWRTRHMAG